MSAIRAVGHDLGDLPIAISNAVQTGDLFVADPTTLADYLAREGRTS